MYRGALQTETLINNAVNAGMVYCLDKTSPAAGYAAPKPTSSPSCRKWTNLKASVNDGSFNAQVGQASLIKVLVGGRAGAPADPGCC